MSVILTSLISDYFKIGAYKKPADWAGDNIDFSLDVSASKPKIDYNFSPFLRDPINAWDFSGVKKEVTVCAPEQTGKSLCFFAGLLWSFKQKPCLSLVVYPSDDKAEKMNRTKLLPLMQKIPSLASELSLPRSHRSDHYNFTNLKSYFQGSGSRISSDSAQICCTDELDDFQEHEKQTSNLNDIRKRQRSFDESILYKVCSPKNSDSAIFDEFENGSQGYWTLQCLNPKCKKHSMRSCDTHHLQFKHSKETYLIEKGSVVLVCPDCGYKHTEDQKHEMNLKGKYIHVFPDRMHDNISFQWGCLASMSLDFTFDKVAQALINAGSTGTVQAQIYFDNSFRGLPLKQRKRNEALDISFKRHCGTEMPKNEDIVYRLLAVDTQDSCFWWICRGYDKNQNSYLLDAGQAITIDDLAKVWDNDYYGGKAVLGIIDAGGHRAQTVASFVSTRDGFYQYKGRTSSNAYRRWEASKECNKLILASAKIYKAELLYTMHGKVENTGRNYFYIPPEHLLQTKYAEYLKQMLDYGPDTSKTVGRKFINYISSGNEHIFDCEKMGCVLNEMYHHFMRLRKKANR